MSIRYLKRVFKDITDRNTQYSRAEKGNEMNKSFLTRPNVTPNCEAEYFPLDAHGILCGFDIYTLLNRLKIHPAKPMRWV